jgi:signal transduction histidine kinase
MCSLRLPRALRVTVAVRGTPRPLSVEQDEALLQITAEALFNAAVHSLAGNVEIVLSYRGQRLTLTIADDGSGDARVVARALGVGRGSQLAGLHRGLANMQSRAEQLGGRLSIRRSPLGGVMVHVTMPAADPPTLHGEVTR